MYSNKCQIFSVPKISSGIITSELLSLKKRIRLVIRRNIPRKSRRKIKGYIMRFLPLSNKKQMSTKSNQAAAHQSTELKFQPGDFVRVRSRVEIESNLSPWGEFKGCAMMDEMWQYCETVQRIKKPVMQFVDERDYQVKKCSGIYLLEDLNCEGTYFFGSCDRSCFYFWREEWLEKI